MPKTFALPKSATLRFEFARSVPVAATIETERHRKIESKHIKTISKTAMPACEGVQVSSQTSTPIPGWPCHSAMPVTQCILLGFYLHLLSLIQVSNQVAASCSALMTSSAFSSWHAGNGSKNKAVISLSPRLIHLVITHGCLLSIYPKVWNSQSESQHITCAERFSASTSWTSGAFATFFSSNAVAAIETSAKWPSVERSASWLQARLTHQMEKWREKISPASNTN